MIDPGAMGRYRRHRDIAWTSFDRFGRYGRVAEILADFPGEGTIVDVGDRSGYLRHFLPSRPSVAFDLEVEKDSFDDVVFGVADATGLPLAAEAVGAAVSCDVLEHLPAGIRSDFLGELVRVARDCVVVTAPFDTIGVSGAESLASRYATVVHGAEQPQLTEHEEHGLPDLAETVGVLSGAGWDVRVEGEGNLFDWLGLMLLRFGTEARDELRPLGDGLDIVYNSMLSSRSATPPYYRHILVATPGTGVVSGLDEALQPQSVTADAVGGALLSQLGQIGLIPRLNALERSLSALDPMVAGHLVNVVGRSDQQYLDLLEGQRALERQIDRLSRRSLPGLAARAGRRVRRMVRRSSASDATDDPT